MYYTTTWSVLLHMTVHLWLHQHLKKSFVSDQSYSVQIIICMYMYFQENLKMLLTLRLWVYRIQINYRLHFGLEFSTLNVALLRIMKLCKNLRIDQSLSYIYMSWIGWTGGVGGGENLISECFSILRTECITYTCIICRILTFFSDTVLLVKRF